MSERGGRAIPATGGSAETVKPRRGQRGWLPGDAGTPMSPAGAKRPNRQTEVIQIQAS